MGKGKDKSKKAEAKAVKETKAGKPAKAVGAVVKPEAEPRVHPGHVSETNDGCELAPWMEGYTPQDPTCDAGQAQLLERLRHDVSQRLSGKRLVHSFGVSQTALWFARREDIDEFDAAAAGLLHDWDKKLPAEELWAKVERYGLDVPRVEGALPVLHGLTAAASLPQEYPELSGEVFQAIARHTTGAVGMSALDMAVYVADMIEPQRTGAFVDDLRALSLTASLRQVYAESVRVGLIYLLESGRFVYPSALEVWNDCRQDAPASQAE